MLQDGPGYSYLASGRVTARQVQGLAEETVRFLNEGPVDSDSDRVIRLEGPWGQPLYVTVLGELGLAIHFTREAAAALLAGASARRLRRHPILSLTLVSPQDWPAELCREITLHQWPIHPLGFPILLRTDGNEVDPAPQDVELMTLCLEAVRRFGEVGPTTLAIGGQPIQVAWEPSFEEERQLGDRILKLFMDEVSALPTRPTRQRARSCR